MAPTKKQGKKKTSITFTVVCDLPVGDGVMDMSFFITFLKNRIKINGKTGVAAVSRDGTKANVTVDLPFSKRYLKYLTKKFLKSYGLRDYIHVVAKSSKTYELVYFNLGKDEEE